MSQSQKAYAAGSQKPPVKPGLIRIYGLRFSPFYQRALLVLQHKNIPYETISVNLKDKPEWFLELNPLGQVPVFQLDDKVIPESTAICDWIDQTYPEKTLQPSDPYRRAWDRVLTEYVNKFLETLFKILKGDPSELEATLEALQKHVTWYENQLKSRGAGPFFGGDEPAMIDFLLWPFFERIPGVAAVRDITTNLLDPEKFPLLGSWSDAMKGRPEVKATELPPEHFAGYIKSFLSGSPNFDIFLDE